MVSAHSGLNIMSVCAVFKNTTFFLCHLKKNSDKTKDIKLLGHLIHLVLSQQ